MLAYLQVRHGTLTVDDLVGEGILVLATETVVDERGRMTASPTDQPDRLPDDRVPRTIDGIAEALRGADRMEFYREVGQADAGEDLQHVVATWWGRAMLATDPEGPATVRAVAAKSLPTVSMAEVIERRRAAGGELPDGV